ncbi:MAG: hypothetical protein Q4B03_00590 [Lachnospiraceae bacterium]|nr:hypothetical protein [Lachnospiraceae bacterium]
MKHEQKPGRVIMNFTGVYDDLSEEKVLYFTDLEGTDGYCSEEAKQVIRERIREYPAEGIHYLDSGNYHYLSELWLEKIRQPFQLAMLDHHTDMQPSALLPLTSCGNWLLECLDTNRFLKKVWLIGPPKESFAELTAEDRARVCFIEQEQADRGCIEELMSGFDPRLPVYLSVDKDILSEDVLSTNWDQGSMTLERLKEWIGFFAGHGTIIGMDLCGEEVHNEFRHVSEGYSDRLRTDEGKGSGTEINRELETMLAAVESGPAEAK